MGRVLCCAALGAACLGMALPAPAEDTDRKGGRDKGALSDQDSCGWRPPPAWPRSTCR